MKDKNKVFHKNEGAVRISRCGFFYELLLEIVNPKAYRDYVRTKLLLEAEQVAAKAKAVLVSKSFLRNIDRVSNQLMKGELDDDD